jgi:endoglucanase
MLKNRQAFSLFLSSLLCLFIFGCGGGGGSDPVTPVTSPQVTPPSTPPPEPIPEEPEEETDDPQISELIVVDQFGYLPNANKVAVLRNPQIGYDSDKTYQPGQEITLVNTDTNEVAYRAEPVTWNNGATDNSSGDKVWWFDFSSITVEGTYAVVDRENALRSASFKVGANIYKDVLKHAFRTLFYQRAGQNKHQPYVPAAWEDDASHIGPGQDIAARLYNTPNDASSERNVSGGWYDAGDYNKYTSWTASYVVTLLHSYIENPAAWGDDFNIPESGNGLSDILDEVKWGVEWLKKMQDGADNGGVLSIVGLAHASPPSAATGPSYYGPASTSATLSTASAFALASRVFSDLGDAESLAYATDLRQRAELAWSWAEVNPAVTFRNNDSAQGSQGLGAGQQEVDNNGRALMKRSAAIYLFAATNNNIYRDYIDANYQQAPLIAWNKYADPYRESENNTLLYYANLVNASSEVAANIKNAYRQALSSEDNLAAIDNSLDPYRAYISETHYTWGSNSVKSLKASMFLNLSTYDGSNTDNEKIKQIALGYLHYLHGVNPQSKVYLSNMYDLGVHNSVNEFYHSWFTDGSQLWDRVGESTYGPAPGFLVGGPNSSYEWDANCNGTSPNAGCGVAAPSPPTGQPAQKSYTDFNTSWPINSWSVTENSNGYQTNYLRVLSKFVD